MDIVLENINEVVLKNHVGYVIKLPYIQECNLGDDYATIVSATENKEIKKGLAVNIIASYASRDVATGEKLENYERDHGEYVLYKIIVESDLDKPCKVTYSFIR